MASNTYPYPKHESVFAYKKICPWALYCTPRPRAQLSRQADQTTGWTIRGNVFDSGQGQETLAFSQASRAVPRSTQSPINPLNPELNSICYLLALLGAHHFFHVSRIRVKSLTLRLLMLYIYMEHLFLMFLDHTQRRSTVGRTPLDE